MTVHKVTVGDQRSLDLGKMTRTHFVKFAGAGGDFNPMHHDDEFARASGFPSVFAMGLLTASLASRLVTDWFGLAAVRSYDVRFKAMVWPGETLKATATLVRTFERGSESAAEIEFAVTNEAGEVKVAGKSEVALAGTTTA